MAYNSKLPADVNVTVSTSDIRENFRALKEDKIVEAATAVTADSAAKLTNARTITIAGDATGSTTFDGSADVTIPVDVISSDVSASCTGNAATATKLETARKINGVAFDGTADIAISADTVGGYTPNNLMPLGAIVMWSGSITVIPDKWALCNGLNGTPNLTNRFVLGAGSSYAVGANGGEATHTLTVNEMPSHNHNMGNGYAPRTNNGDTDPWSVAKGGDSNISASYIAYTGGNQPHNNMPPYYALAYIMRIA